MVRNLSISAAWAAGLAASPVWAEDDGSTLDRIEVTGGRITYRDLLPSPATAITQGGDYFPQHFTLINDSRSPEGRRAEIDATFRTLIAHAGQRYVGVHDGVYAQVLRADSPVVQPVDDPRPPDNTRGVSLRGPADIDSVEPGQIEYLRTRLGSGPEVPLDGINSRIE